MVWRPSEFGVVRAAGLDGPHAAFLDVYPREALTGYFKRPLRNLTPGGTYWVELWYRDIVRPGTAPQANVQVQLVSEGPAGKPPVVVADSAHVPLLKNSYHQWHKMSFKLKAPLAHDYLLVVNFHGQNGAILYDSLSIRPVSDQQQDALINFLEGKTP